MKEITQNIKMLAETLDGVKAVSIFQSERLSFYHIPFDPEANNELWTAFGVPTALLENRRSDGKPDHIGIDFDGDGKLTDIEREISGASSKALKTLMSKDSDVSEEELTKKLLSRLRKSKKIKKLFDNSVRCRKCSV